MGVLAALAAGIAALVALQFVTPEELDVHASTPASHVAAPPVGPEASPEPVSVEGATVPVEAAPTPPPAETEENAIAPEVATAEQGDLPDLVAQIVPPSLTRVAPPSADCARALAVVEAAGLILPQQTAFRCPGSAQTFPGDRQHSGVACWDHSNYCPGRSFIAVNPDEIRPMDRALQYVVAHEICHIHSYIETGSPGSEPAADACAAAAGFGRP